MGAGGGVGWGGRRGGGGGGTDFADQKVAEGCFFWGRGLPVQLGGGGKTARKTSWGDEGPVHPIFGKIFGGFHTAGPPTVPRRWREKIGRPTIPPAGFRLAPGPGEKTLLGWPGRQFSSCT